MHFKYKDKNQLKVKGWKSYTTNNEYTKLYLLNKAGATILISHKVDFRVKNSN